MRFLHTAVTVSMSTEKMELLAEKLREEHYPYAIDNLRKKLIAFNVPVSRMNEIWYGFFPHYITIERCARPRLPYIEIFKHVSQLLGRNAMSYADVLKFKFLEQGKTPPMKHEVIHLAYEKPNYPDAPEMRDYISSELYGIDANNPTEYVDEIVGSDTPRDRFIKNYLIMTFRGDISFIEPRHSCLGSEAWAFNKEAHQIICFNIPKLDLELIFGFANPVTLSYSSGKYPQPDSELYKYVRSEIANIRRKQRRSLKNGYIRVPFTPHLMGIDESQFD